MSSKAGILQEPNLGGEVTSNVTSSSGPVKFTDLQRILSNIESADMAVDPDEALLHCLIRLRLQGWWSPEDILELLQSLPFRQQMDSLAYVLRTGHIDLTQFGIDPSKYLGARQTILYAIKSALEDSVAKTSESEESRQDNTDLRSESCDRKGPMDES
ncbi:hypothetical protein C1H46_019929 [Malus baccata]|uniref:Uncharacterized protein n=1 Tax=Malus baccata TaxID=106549 RepID=A0A540M7H4_MALBA|nr:hypothetical protein C1H46_019929 [Malus baccata]